MIALLLALNFGNMPPPPPDSQGCVDRFPNTVCQTDNQRKGTCVMQDVRTADFSKLGPPTFAMVR